MIARTWREPYVAAMRRLGCLHLSVRQAAISFEPVTSLGTRDAS